MLKKYILSISVLYTLVLLTLSLVTLNTGKSLAANSDKVFHFVAHFLVVILWFFTFYIRLKQPKTKALMQSFVFSLCFGIIVEVFQEVFTTTREADINDVIANIAGATLGIVVVGLLHRKQ